MWFYYSRVDNNPNKKRTIMRKLTLLATALFMLSILFSKSANAQEGNKSVLMLELNQSAYEMLVRNSEERGVSTDEIAKWIVDNGRLTVKSESGMNESGGKLLLYLISERGVVGKSSYQIIISERPVSLSRMMNGRQLAGDIDRFFPDSTFFPDSVFFPGSDWFPGDYFIPGDTFMRSDREIEQMAVEAGRKAISSMRSAEGNGLAIVMFAVPEKVDPNDQISTIPAIVAGGVK